MRAVLSDIAVMGEAAERLKAGAWGRSLYLRRISTFRMTFRGLVLVSDECHFIDCFAVSLRF